MSIEITYRCDECKRPRGQANHWWVAFVRRGKGKPHEFAFRAMQTVESPGKDGSSKKFLCGEECLSKAQKRFINSLAPRPEQQQEALTQ